MSDFGAQLDSLCDLMSFGMAPAFLLVKMCPRFTSVHNQGVWIIAAVFVCCAALRLARFNVETDEEDDHTMFAGLPTPAAAAVIASFAILSYRLRSDVASGEFFRVRFADAAAVAAVCDRDCRADGVADSVSASAVADD